MRWRGDRENQRRSRKNYHFGQKHHRRLQEAVMLLTRCCPDEELIFLRLLFFYCPSIWLKSHTPPSSMFMHLSLSFFPSLSPPTPPLQASPRAARPPPLLLLSVSLAVWPRCMLGFTDLSSPPGLERGLHECPPPTSLPLAPCCDASSRPMVFLCQSFSLQD